MRSQHNHDIPEAVHHRNTLQQRFNKIEKLTGFSVHNADGLLTLRLALLCYNYLQAGGGDLPYV